MALANPSNYWPDPQLVTEALAETIKGQIFWPDPLAYETAVETAKQRLREKHRVYYGDGPPFIGPLAFQHLKPQNTGYFVEWFLQPEIKRFEFFHDTALVDSHWYEWGKAEKRGCLYTVGQIEINKDYYGSVGHWAQAWANTGPIYGSTRRVLFEQNNFCHRFEYPASMRPFPHIPPDMETVVYFRDTLSLALLYGHWETAQTISDIVGGWTFNRQPQEWEANVIGKESAIFSVISTPSMQELSHTCCFIEGVYREFRWVDRSDPTIIEPMSQACIRLLTDTVIRFDWAAKYRELMSVCTNRNTVISVMKEAIFCREFPPWLQTMAVRPKSMSLASEMAQILFEWCDQNPVHNIQIVSGAVGGAIGGAAST